MCVCTHWGHKPKVGNHSLGLYIKSTLVTLCAKLAKQYEPGNKLQQHFSDSNGHNKFLSWLEYPVGHCSVAVEVFVVDLQ